MSTGKVRPSRVEEAPLVAAVEQAPVRLTPAAAERVAMAGAAAYYEADQGVSLVGHRLKWEPGRHRDLWIAATRGTVEAVVAELRLAGWKVEPPGGQELRGGV